MCPNKAGTSVIGESEGTGEGLASEHELSFRVGEPWWPFNLATYFTKGLAKEHLSFSVMVPVQYNSL